MALADGVSTCPKGGAGAAVTAETLAQLLTDKKAFFFSAEKATAAQNIMDVILERLTAKADGDGCSVGDYASTAAAVMTDGTHLLCLSLGDSLILGICRDGCRVLCQPADSTDGLCATTTRGAGRELQLLRTDCADLDAVVLLSDGAWRLLYEKNRLKPEAEALLRKSDFLQLQTYLQSMGPQDDCSFIALHHLPKHRRIVL